MWVEPFLYIFCKASIKTTVSLALQGIHIIHQVWTSDLPDFFGALLPTELTAPLIISGEILANIIA